MTIWLIMLPFGAATYAMRGAFLFHARASQHTAHWQRWLRLVPPVVLAALVLPALVSAGNLLAPDTLRQLLAAGLAALVAWRTQPVLLTVGIGMGALWGLNGLPETITLVLPLGLLLVAGAGLLLLLVGSALAWLRLKQRARRPALGARPHSTVTPMESRLLTTKAAFLPEQRSADLHTHCIRCWCPLPTWANFCGQCGLLQPLPGGLDLAPTQPLAAVLVRPRRATSAFWLLWTGQTISALGSSFTQVALPLLVYKLTGSALTLGLATAAELLPYLLFGLPIGAWVDRLPRKRLLLAVTMLQASTLAVIPGLFLLGALSAWWLYGLAFVSTTLKQDSETCQIALLPGLIESARLTIANGRLQAGVSTAQLVGPVLAGALVLLVPLPLLLLVDAASFLIAAGLFAGLRVRFQQEAAPPRQLLRQAMGEGLRYVWRDPVLRSISLVTPLVNGVSIVAGAQLVLFARVQYHASASAISLLYAATSGGYLLFSLLAGPLRRYCPFPVTTLGALALMGVLIGLMGVTPWFWLGVVFWGLSQGAEMLFTLHARSYAAGTRAARAARPGDECGLCAGLLDQPAGRSGRGTGHCLAWAGADCLGLHGPGGSHRPARPILLRDGPGACRARCGLVSSPCPRFTRCPRQPAPRRAARRQRWRSCREGPMDSLEAGIRLPVLPLAPAAAQTQRRLRFGRIEAEIVRVLLAQREYACQQRGRTPLCVSLAALAEQIGMPPENLTRAISRVNGKLPALGLTITHLRCGLEPVGYAIFELAEVRANL
jgi:branched-subunit amino acid transport protein/MFS family permease